MRQLLEKQFALAEHGTTVRREVTAGVTTFLAMAYITVVNPSILSAAGMDFGAVFVATCLAAALGTAVMGLYANYPVAQAPGMGQNAFFAFGMAVSVAALGWQGLLSLRALGFSALLSPAVPLALWLARPLSARVARHAIRPWALGLAGLAATTLLIRLL